MFVRANLHPLLSFVVAVTYATEVVDCMCIIHVFLHKVSKKLQQQKRILQFIHLKEVQQRRYVPSAGCNISTLVAVGRKVFEKRDFVALTGTAAKAGSEKRYATCNVSELVIDML